MAVRALLVSMLAMLGRSRPQLRSTLFRLHSLLLRARPADGTADTTPAREYGLNGKAIKQPVVVLPAFPLRAHPLLEATRHIFKNSSMGP